MHLGATSQDVVDSALMVMVGRVGAILAEDLAAAQDALAELARAHRSTPMVARSLAQHSLPSTFGLRAANWLDGLGQAADRLAAAVADLPVQWGGAAGTLASLSGHVDRAHRAGTLGPEVTAFTLVEDLAAELGLAAPAGPWDTNRMAVTGVAAALADVVAACGKIANDVLTSARIENGELGEPLAAGRGGSSAMPHKQNPVLSVLIRSAALSAPGLAARVYTAAGAADDERPDGAWHAEWPALRRLLRVAGGTAALTRELVSGLRVHEDRMRRNLELTGPLLVSERIMAELAPELDEASGEPFSMAELADAVVAAVQALQEDGTVPADLPVHFAGVSLNGCVALQLALDHADTVSGVAVICSAAKIGEAGSWRERAELVERAGTPTLVEGSAQRWFADGFIAAHPERTTGLLHTLQEADRHSYARLCEALADFDVRGRLGEIAVPVLTIHGVADQVTPPSAGEEIAAAVPGTVTHVFDETAHQAPLEQPERTAAALAAFPAR
ncbi:lyase family protein [Micrococcus sp. Alg238-R198]|uniref:lyase family protein n=1 Tax=Micrococcus sp. Alg238-R198 TaxID=2305988 RepID=UPI001F07BA6D|nr:lyase family protein [Micrococcus sp. Alg238-R198]